LLIVETTGIPAEELQKFEQNLLIYHAGAEILVEGRTDDRAIYLLRKGQVGVFRNVGSEAKRIATIDAVNVFGEMALASGGPRTATIKALTDDVVVYKFLHPDIHAALANPTWGELLVKRLAANLKNTSDRLVATEGELNTLQARDANLSIHTLVLITAFSELVNRVADDVVVNSREWHFLHDLATLTDHYVRDHLPDLYCQMGEYRLVALKRMSREPSLPTLLRGIISEILHQMGK
jgi:CRP-like cAMP-binding protein